VSDLRKPAYTVETLPGLADPIVRAREAEITARWMDDRARQARAIRNEAIRAARAARVSKPQISAETGISSATVKGVLR